MFEAAHPLTQVARDGLFFPARIVSLDRAMPSVLGVSLFEHRVPCRRTTSTRMRHRFASLTLSLALVAAAPALGDSTEGQQQPDDPTPSTRSSKSGYEEPDAIGGGTSVGTQLIDDDKVKKPILSFRFLHDDFYEFKRRLRDTTGIELNIDYNFLNQVASYSTSDRHGSSGSIRFYGRWFPPWAKKKGNGSLVFRFENRHTIGPQTPKELGFATGSSLSTAGFKEFGFGTTALYWAQKSEGERFAFVAGQMDPGDFEDIHPLLNPWTAFMNDASFNNPTTALPNQGLGVVVRGFVTDHLYLKGGINDANGDPTEIDFKSFFDVQEFFTWAEVGWAPNPTREQNGESIHLLVWHSDERVEAEVPEGWGLAFSAAGRIGKNWLPFVRAGYSEGDAANLSAMVSIGSGFSIRSDGLLGVAATWARPPASEQGRDQFTVEGFYRFQLTDNVQVTPGFYFHYRPSYSPSRDAVWVGSVFRIRFVL